LAGGKELARHARVDGHCVEQFPFGDALLGGVCHVNAARPDQVRPSPGAVEGRNVCSEGDDGGGKAVKGVEMNGGVEEHFKRFDFAQLGGPSYTEAQLGGVADQTKHDLGAGLVGNDVWGAAAANGADVQRGLAENRIAGKRKRADVSESIEKRMNGGVTQFGISGMGEFAASDEFVSQDTLGAERQSIFGGFAVDEKARATGRGGRSVGASAVALFADNEKEGEIAGAGSEKRFRGVDHGSDDALGVATAAAVDVRVVLGRGKIGWNGVHVSGEGNDRVAEGKEEIVAIGCGRLALEATVVAIGERGEVREKEVNNGLFATGGGIEVDESAS